VFEPHSYVHIGKPLLDAFPIQNGLKQGGALSPLPVNFALDAIIRFKKIVWVGLQVKAEKTKYMFMSHHQNAQQYENIKTVNKVFKNSAKLSNWERQ
jgi:hypothetical protein